MLSRGMRSRLPWFLAVGAAASVLHWAVVVLLVGTLRWQPLAANVGGWLMAFGVSYLGHRRLTFGDLAPAFGSSLRRFFALSAAGFVLNQAAYAVLLHLSPLRYDLLLACVLVGVAGATFVLSRRWAFAAPGQVR